MRKKYADCQRADGNCTACSLVNYGRDCHNRPITKLEWSRRVAGLTQAITFAPIAPQKTTAAVGLRATGGASGNPVTFAVASGPGSIAGATNWAYVTSRPPSCTVPMSAPRPRPRESR